MIIENDHFYHINIPIDFINTVHDELKYSTWYTSKTGQCRSEIVGETRKLIQKTMPFTISCCGFYKNEPGWKYTIHKDYTRFTALNILLVDNSEDYHVYTYSDNLKEKVNIPYIKNKPMLLNTKKYHSVHNISKEKIRYVLTVGCNTETYEVIRDRVKQMAILSESSI
jgi:pyoverdine/dityrosine biosynthesis protein Dit1